MNNYLFTSHYFFVAVRLGDLPRLSRSNRGHRRIKVAAGKFKKTPAIVAGLLEVGP